MSFVTPLTRLSRKLFYSNEGDEELVCREVFRDA